MVYKMITMNETLTASDSESFTLVYSCENSFLLETDDANTHKISTQTFAVVRLKSCHFLM